jgi:hypothetical protein
VNLWEGFFDKNISLASRYATGTFKIPSFTTTSNLLSQRPSGTNP